MLRRALLTLVVGCLTFAFASAGASAQDEDGRPEKAVHVGRVSFEEGMGATDYEPVV
jgi:hypothetical protein